MPALDSVAASPRREQIDLGGARVAFERAAARAQVSMTTLDDLEGMRSATALWQRIWDRRGGESPPIGVDLLRALTHGGAYLAGAWHDGQLVGALLGFFTVAGERVRLHSHILGVDPGARTRGVGFALKLHQRLWALERGIDEVAWTFDPLVRANAYLNLGKLGGLGTEYHVDFYGALGDAINGDGASDRILVTWRLDDPRVDAACLGRPWHPDVESLRRAGAEVALRAGSDRQPIVSPPGHAADVVLCAVPDDVVALRARDPKAAATWRLALREALLPGLRRGLVVTGATRDGWYVLQREAGGGTG